MNIVKKVTPNLNVTLSWKATSNHYDVSYSIKTEQCLLNTSLLNLCISY